MMTPVERNASIESLRAIERADVRLLSDADLGTHAVWLRRSLLLASDEGLADWVIEHLQLRADVAESDLQWRKRAESKGGPTVDRGNWRERIDQARLHTDIIEAILLTGVNLKKSGREWAGLCPFHQENSPSFSVNPAAKLWHCFGCGRGGDLFSFLELRLNLPFPEVLRMVEQGGSIPRAAYAGALA